MGTSNSFITILHALLHMVVRIIENQDVIMVKLNHQVWINLREIKWEKILGLRLIEKVG